MKNDSVWAHLDAFLFRVCDRDSGLQKIASLLLEMSPAAVAEAEKLMVSVKFCVREGMRGNTSPFANPAERLIMAVWFAHLFSRALPWTGVRLAPSDSALEQFDVFVETKSVRGELATVNIREFIYAYSGMMLGNLYQMTDDVMTSIKGSTKEVFVRQYAMEMDLRTKMQPSIIRVLDDKRPF